MRRRELRTEEIPVFPDHENAPANGNIDDEEDDDQDDGQGFAEFTTERLSGLRFGPAVALPDVVV